MRNKIFKLVCKHADVVATDADLWKVTDEIMLICGFLPDAVKHEHGLLGRKAELVHIGKVLRESGVDK